jgi:WhiB family redox-sensing transcriptional regulator
VLDEFGFYKPEPPKYEFIALDIFLALQKPEWQDYAACKTPDAGYVDTFFPEINAQGGNHLSAARKICMECPVRYECLEAGLNEAWGVWGGYSPSQRRRINSAMKNGSSLLEASQAIDARSRDAR